MERIVRIERLVHGGDGLARDEGRVVFVPLVAPGDLARVRLGEAQGGALHAELVELLEPGPARVVPACPLVGQCGGCDRQQLSLDGQLAAKEEAVADALERLGGLGLGSLRPIVPSPRPTRYRRRLRAHLAGDGWGFRERASHRVVRTSACLLVEEEVERFAHLVAPLLKKLGLRPESFALDVVDGRGAAHLALLEKPAPAVQAKAAKLLSLVRNLRGVVLTGPQSAPVTVGDPVLIDLQHRRLRVRPDLFAQANRLGARLVAEHVAQSVAPGAHVLELFAGAGTLTLHLAAQAGSLVATEGEGPALSLLRASLAENGHPARLIGGPARRVLLGLAAENAQFDHLVLDPPRAGAKEALEAIGKLAPQRITYVSCDPATFARDAAALVQGGYRLDRTTPYDLFPHTHHVELVAELSRG